MERGWRFKSRANESFEIACNGKPGLETYAGHCPVPHGVWLAASFRLEAPQPADQPYPHTCVGRYPVAYPGRDCPACASNKQSARMLP